MFGQGGTQVQPDGSFRFDGLSPGEYILTVEETGDDGRQERGYAKVQIVDWNIRTSILLGSAAQIRGQIVTSASHAPLRSGATLLLASESSIEAFPATLDSARRFNIPNIPPGDYRFVLVGEASRRFYIGKATCGDVDYATRKLSLNATTLLNECEITLSQGTGLVRGQVMDGDTPRPLLFVCCPNRRRQ
jgi:hypothetical protein